VKAKLAEDAPDFQNNVVDARMTFHTDGGVWKVRDSDLLGDEWAK
jgi:hypothetical protein